MMFTYLRRELRRRRKAQLVISLGLALGIALVVIVNAVSSGMRKAQDDVLESLYGLGTDMTVTREFEEPEEGERRGPRFEFDAEEGAEQSSDQLVVEGFGTLDDSRVAEIAGIDGVANAAGSLRLSSISVSGSFDPGEITEGEEGGEGDQSRPPAGDGGPRVGGGGADFGVDGYSILGTDVSEPELGPLNGAEITDGRGFATDETNDAVALLDADYAASEDLAVGDTLTIKGTDFEIVGLVNAAGADAASDAYIPLKQAQTLSESEGELTDIYVQAADSTRLDAIETAITDRIDSAQVTTADDLADQVSGSLSTAADLADGVGRWLSWIVLGTSFVVAGMMASSAVSRRVREFGTLKALGWTRRRVTGQVMSESLVTGLVGGAIGLGLGVLAAWAITTVKPGLTADLAGGLGQGPGGGGGPVMIRPGGAGGEASENAAGSGGGGGGSLDIGLTAPVSLDMLTIAVTLAVIGGLIAGAFAAWRAARLRPADALRRVA
ncbi:ABC transporter permease [Streptomyces sp. 6N223]|uniref:ABC transporter permease n=1 Tax=Streptomyces sp. 6N223 TaxID=3457412 RepID=UPI003FCF1B83